MWKVEDNLSDEKKKNYRISEYPLKIKILHVGFGS